MTKKQLTILILINIITIAVLFAVFFCFNTPLHVIMPIILIGAGVEGGFLAVHFITENRKQE